MIAPVLLDTAISLVSAVKCSQFTGWKRKTITDGEEFLLISPDNTRIYAIVAYPNSMNGLARVRQNTFFTAPGIDEIHVSDASISGNVLTVIARTCERYVIPIEARA